MSHCYVRQTGLWSRSFGNQTSVIISEKDYVTVKKNMLASSGLAFTGSQSFHTYNFSFFHD